MEIKVRGKRLNKELTEPKAMTQAFGDRARPLQRRLDLLKAVKCLAEVPIGSPCYRHQLIGNREGQYAVTIKDNWRLIFEPDHEPVPRLADNGVDISQVTAITIIEVEDYHGK